MGLEVKKMRKTRAALSLMLTASMLGSMGTLVRADDRSGIAYQAGWTGYNYNWSISNDGVLDCTYIPGDGSEDAVTGHWNDSNAAFDTLRLSFPNDLDNRRDFNDLNYERAADIRNVYVGENIGDVNFTADCSNIDQIYVSEDAVGLNFEYLPISGIPDITANGSVKTNAVYSNCNNLTSVVVPRSYSTFGQVHFTDCDNLQTVAIERGNTRLNCGEFNGCDSLSYVSIPATVTYIEYYSFHNCDDLTSIMIPSSVTTIYEDAFVECDNLQTIYVGMREEVWNSNVGIWRHETAPGVQDHVVAGLHDLDTDADIVFINSSDPNYDSSVYELYNPQDPMNPLHYSWGSEGNSRELGIGFITEERYNDVMGLMNYNPRPWYESVCEPVSLTITNEQPADPNGRSVAFDQFVANDTIRRVTLEGNFNAVSSLSLLHELRYLDITDLNSGTDISFKDCEYTSLPLITTGSHDDNRYSVTFDNGVNFDDLYIPNCYASQQLNWRVINSPNLTDVTMGNNIRTLPRWALARNSRLENVSLPDNLVTIEYGAFYCCTSLPEIEIPATVTTLRADAFAGDTALKDIYFNCSSDYFYNEMEVACNVEASGWNIPLCAYDHVFDGIDATLHFTDGNISSGPYVRTFVDRLYKIALESDIDMTQRDQYVEELLAGDVTGGDLARDFLLGDAVNARGLSNEDFVTLVWLTLYGRDLYGEYIKEELSAALSNGSMTRSDVVNDLLGRPMWTRLCEIWDIIPGPTASEEPGGGTSAPSTPAPSTPGASTPAPSTPAPSTPAPSTPAPTQPVSPSSGRSADHTASGFVDRLYNVALGRESDPQGHADWLDAIMSGRVSGAEAAKGFLLSPEFINRNYSDEEFVTILYNTFFGREPDPEGKAAWMNALANGASREEILDGFINSTEWANLCLTYGIVSGGTGTPNIEVEPNEQTIEFVRRLYSICLERQADEAGLMAWARQLANQRDTGSGVARGFFFSSEFTGRNYSNGEYVTRLYRAILGREPDEAGLAAWTAQLDAGTASREEVFDGFAGSPEFGQICANYGILR